MHWGWKDSSRGGVPASKRVAGDADTIDKERLDDGNGLERE